MSLTPLSELIPWYPTCAPQSLEELCGAAAPDVRSALADTEVSSDVIDQVLRLRAQGMDLKQGADKLPPLSSADAVLKALANGWLKPRARMWMIYPLDARRRRVAVANSAGGSRYVTKIAKKVPDPDDLPPIPDGGTYLVLFGGGPQVLEIGGVPERLRRLAEHVPVADVVFWHLTKEHPDTLYSLRYGCGDASGTRVEFPIDESQLEKARCAFEHHH